MDSRYTYRKQPYVPPTHPQPHFGQYGQIPVPSYPQQHIPMQQHYVQHNAQTNVNTQQTINRPRVKLHDGSVKEREKYSNMADLYSIIIRMERLEKAYVRDAIKADEYTKACSKLISQFKTLQPILKEYVPDVKQFMKDYKISCPAAEYRLLQIGVPATVEHGSGKSGDSIIIAETVQYFITAMDALKIDCKSVDQLQPYISDLVETLSKIPLPEFDGKQKLKSWLIILNQMKAHEELNEEQVRQLLFDLENAYNTFHKLLKSK